jgi:hypothetical protein
MKIKIYLFRLAITLTTFFFAVTVFNALHFFQAQVFALRAEQPVKVPIAEPKGMRSDTEFVEQIKNEQAEITQQPETVFDATGSYYFDGEKPPKGFENFDFLEIIARDYETGSNEYVGGAPIPPKGFVQTKKPYKFVRISIGDKEISFETEKISGISYRFDGRFRSDDSYLSGENAADLTGRLVKLKNGKKIAEAKAEFFAGGC